MSTLLFAGTSESQLRATRSAIKTELKDTYNRLHSIAYDANFVAQDVKTAFPDFPIVANLRAGAWYTNLVETSSILPVYFKSTDGHAGEHQFNLRRANLKLILVIQEHNGVVLVDVTRRGKRFPDALSKTIPNWCAVLNRVRIKLLPLDSTNSTVSQEGWNEDGKLWTLPSAVSRSEHSQMEAKIEGWADNLIASAYDLSPIKLLNKPLRPIFISPASHLVLSPSSSFEDFHPVVLVSASKLAEEAEDIERASGFTYVQGGGDDHELWSQGLTPSLFWEHFDRILSTSRSDLQEVIEEILLSSISLEVLSILPLNTSKEIRQTTIEIDFTPERSQIPSDSHLFISLDLDKVTSISSPLDQSTSSITLTPRTGKAGYSSFFDSLSPILDAVLVSLLNEKKVVVRVFNGESLNDSIDLVIALAMIILFKYFDSNGVIEKDIRFKKSATKNEIRIRLQWILEIFPSVNPSRSILNRVNSYLIFNEH